MKINSNIITKFKNLCEGDDNLMQCLKGLFLFELEEKGHYMNQYEEMIEMYAERGDNENNKD